MANSLISMVKGDSTLINNTEVLNGQILFDETKQKIFLDDNTERKEYGGSDDNAVKKDDVAYVESAMVATRGYSAGNYIIVQDTLYKATTQINSGTALVVGTNVSTTTIGKELTQINASLSNKADRSELVPFTTFKTNNDGAHLKMQISTQAYDDSALIGKFNVCQWNSDTYDTPYKSGLTAFGNGFIVTYKISEQYYTQLAMAVGDTNIFSRRCDSGSWSPWEIIGGKTSTNSATFNSGITINSQTLRRRGNIVVFGFNLTLPTTSSDTVIGTLPIGYRPSADIYGIAEKNNPGVDSIEQGFCIKTNGDIQLTNASSGGICRGSITFII